MPVWTEIDALDAPAAGIFDFVAPVLTGYKALQLVLVGLQQTGQNGAFAYLQFRIGGALIATGYTSATIMTYGADTNNDAVASTVLALGSNSNPWMLDDAADAHLGGIIDIPDPLSTTIYKGCHYQLTMIQNDGATSAQGGYGRVTNTGAIEGIRLGVSGTGAFQAGKVRLLGMP